MNIRDIDFVELAPDFYSDLSKEEQTKLIDRIIVKLFSSAQSVHHISTKETDDPIALLFPSAAKKIGNIALHAGVFAPYIPTMLTMDELFVEMCFREAVKNSGKHIAYCIVSPELMDIFAGTPGFNRTNLSKISYSESFFKTGTWRGIQFFVNHSLQSSLMAFLPVHKEKFIHVRSNQEIIVDNPELITVCIADFGELR